MLRYWESPETTGVGRLRPQPEPEGAASSLNGTWRFQRIDSPTADPGHEWTDVVVPSLWTMGDFDDPPQYTNVQMPFAQQPPFVPIANPTGVYERAIAAPAGWRDSTTLLRIGGFEGALRVELNGELIGIAKDGRIAAEFVLDAALVDGDNQLRLIISKWSDATFIEDQDQWWHAGISRSVELIRRPRTHVSQLDLTPGYEGGVGRLRIRAGLVFAGGDAAPGHWLRVRVQELDASVDVPLSDGLGAVPTTAEELAIARAWFMSEYAVDGNPPAARAFLQALEPMRAGDGDAVVHIDGVKPWSAEKPHLYTVCVEHFDPAGIIRERFEYRIGFRSVAIEDGELRVNGRAVMIRGVNRHDFHPRTGKVLGEADIRADLEELKRWNVNAIRTSHYPNDPALLRVADELGFYVVAEANIESHAFMHSLCDDPRYLNAFVDRVARMVIRDQAHASVILWSLGNESGYGANHDAAAAWVRRFDATRPLHYEGAIRGDWDAGRRVTDVVCPMYPSIPAIIRYATDGPQDRPLIMCEYSHAMGNSNGSLADYWAAIEAHPRLQGGFIWEMWDHGLLQRTADGSERYAYGGDYGESVHDGNFCCDGMFFPDRTAKPAMHEFKQLASPIVIREVAAATGRFTVHNRQDFSDASDFRIAWSVSTEGETVASGLAVLPALDPRATADLHLPEFAAYISGAGESFVTISIQRTSATAWSPEGFEVGWAQFRLPMRRARVDPKMSVTRMTVENDGRVTIAGMRFKPELSLWRAPTDNDRIGGVSTKWDAWGLRRLRREITGRDPLPGGGLAIRSLWHTATGRTVEHHQVVTPCDGGVQVREHLFVPEEFDDVARVGTVVVLGQASRFEWFGAGPVETYPDRRLAQVGRWSADGDGAAVPYIRPQENGAHTGVRWLEFTAKQLRWRLTTDEPRQVSFTPYCGSELAEAAHWSELPKPWRTVLHVDAAHRGVGTASCGPDVLPQYRIPTGVHAWMWRLQQLAVHDEKPG